MVPGRKKKEQRMEWKRSILIVLVQGPQGDNGSNGYLRKLEVKVLMPTIEHADSRLPRALFISKQSSL